MNEKFGIEIIEKAKEFFKNEIVLRHIEVSCVKASRLSEYKINPFLSKYLANFLTGNNDSLSIARALVLPRIMGSSINTMFGMKIQQMMTTIFDGLGSTTQGIDIEFMDQIDNRKKYCQLKAGPNTINHDDVTTVINHFKGIKNIARTNSLNISLDDLIVGVIYGNKDELSSHYKKIGNSYPVFVGQDFWHRLTGDQDFYYKLIDAIAEVAIEVDGRKIIEETVQMLAKEIDKNYK